MEYINPWPLLRAGKAEQEQGLRLVQRAYAEQPYPSQAMEFGVALLWLRRYGEAWEHFHSVIETEPHCGDGDFGMAGVAKWCLGKPDEAVHEWRAGVDAKYARASGLSIIMPLLLFFAAVQKPDVFDRKLAEKLMREMAQNIRIMNWPGPIALLVLDQISEVEFKKYCRGIRPSDDKSKNPFLGHGPHQTANCLWQAEFYKSVMEYEPGKNSAFRESMLRLADTSQPEWQDERNVFTARLWHEEFFLSRFIAETTA